MQNWLGTKLALVSTTKQVQRDTCFPYLEQFITGGGTSLSLLITAIYNAYKWCSKIQFTIPTAHQVGYLSTIWIYPIKGCAGIEVSEALCTSKGLFYHGLMDRQYLVLDEKTGQFCGLKTHPELLLIKPTYDISTGCVTVHRNGYKSYTICDKDKKWDPSRTREIRWFDETKRYGLDCGEDAANWFSDVLGKGCRLMYSHEKFHQAHDPDLMDPPMEEEQWHRGRNAFMSFQAVSSYLLTCDWSVDYLNEHLTNQISHKNFRPNLNVTGDGEPFSEDKWKKVMIGEKAQLSMEKPCVRCIVITINPETGVTCHDIYKKLIKLHRGSGRSAWQALFGLCMGICGNVEPHVIRTGDSIRVVEQ